jgi:hypothetical protein
MLAAAEAVEEALLVADRERGRLLVMERAQAGIFRTGLALERDLAADHVAQAEARAQFIEKARGEAHYTSVTVPSSGRERASRG